MKLFSTCIGLGLRSLELEIAIILSDFRHSSLSFLSNTLLAEGFLYANQLSPLC